VKHEQGKDEARPASRLSRGGAPNKFRTRYHSGPAALSGGTKGRRDGGTEGNYPDLVNNLNEALRTLADDLAAVLDNLD